MNPQPSRSSSSPELSEVSRAFGVRLPQFVITEDGKREWPFSTFDVSEGHPESASC